MIDVSAIFDPENDHLFKREYALGLFKHIIGEEECQHYNKKKDSEEDHSDQ